VKNLAAHRHFKNEAGHSSLKYHVRNR